MKTSRIVVLLFLLTGLLFSATSCVVFVKKDNGRHEGWYKNTNNPQNPDSKNPGQSNKRQNK